MNVARILYPVKVLGPGERWDFDCVDVIVAVKAAVIRNYGS